MINILLTLLLSGILWVIIRYLYKSKKRGTACIGCPHAKKCNKKCH